VSSEERKNKVVEDRARRGEKRRWEKRRRGMRWDEVGCEVEVSCAMRRAETDLANDLSNTL
jgi:hypothetical protein